LRRWERSKGDSPGVVRALLAADADLPKPEYLAVQGTEELLAVPRQHEG
jgi:hypothetical protein